MVVDWYYCSSSLITVLKEGTTSVSVSCTSASACSFAFFFLLRTETNAEIPIYGVRDLETTGTENYIRNQQDINYLVDFFHFVYVTILWMLFHPLFLVLY